jgi:hypothetical protein
MSIKNEMEALVRDEVARVREAGSSGYTGCWCSLCETDVVALALTLLPPLYSRTETFGIAAGFIKAAGRRSPVPGRGSRRRSRPRG